MNQFHYGRGYSWLVAQEPDAIRLLSRIERLRAMILPVLQQNIDYRQWLTQLRALDKASRELQQDITDIMPRLEARERWAPARLQPVVVDAINVLRKESRRLDDSMSPVRDMLACLDHATAA